MTCSIACLVMLLSRSFWSTWRGAQGVLTKPSTMTSLLPSHRLVRLLKSSCYYDVPKSQSEFDYMHVQDSQKENATAYSE